jgi:hypothetical protein
MAKRGQNPKDSKGPELPGGRTAGDGNEFPGGQPTQRESGGAVEGVVGQFAEDLGKLVGEAQSKAEGWLSQRQTIVKNLTDLRDTVNGLLSRMADGYEAGNARTSNESGGAVEGKRADRGRSRR